MNNAARNIPGAQGVALDEPHRDCLRRLVERVGETEALRLLEISRHVLARCLAELPLQRATAAYVARRLDEIDLAREVG